MNLDIREEPGLQRLVLLVDGQDVLTIEPVWTNDATPWMVDEESASMLISLITMATKDSTPRPVITSEAQLQLAEEWSDRLSTAAERARNIRADAIESLTKLRDELG